MSEYFRCISGRYTIFVSQENQRKKLHFNGLLSKEHCLEDEVVLKQPFIGEVRLDVLVENPGRVNFSQLDDERKDLVFFLLINYNIRFF